VSHPTADREMSVNREDRYLMIRTLLVDDHTLVRTALGHLIQSAGDIQIVAEAESGEDALKKLREEPVDVVLCDILMPGIGGMETIRRIRARDEKIGLVAITAQVDVSLARNVLAEGVHAYVTKDAPADELIEAIRHAFRRDRFVSSRIAREIALSSTKGDVDPFDALSGREMQVLMMILEGTSNQQISERLCLSPKTVSTYRTRLLEKLGVSNDIELLRLAARQGLVELDGSGDKGR